MKRYTYHVEEHTGGMSGLAAGLATGVYVSRRKAEQAMKDAYRRGNHATCIRRDESGVGSLLTLGLVPALPPH